MQNQLEIDCCSENLTKKKIKMARRPYFLDGFDSEGEDGMMSEEAMESEESEDECIIFERTPWVPFVERQLQELDIDSLPYADSDLSPSSDDGESETESQVEEDLEVSQQEIATLRAEAARLRALREQRRVHLQELHAIVEQAVQEVQDDAMGVEENAQE